jgi:uncharacterized protein with gpF-like domain
MKPFIFGGFKQGILQGQQQGGKLTVEDIFTESVRLALQQRTLEHATLAIGTTKDKLQKILTTAFEEGQGVQELARNINNYFAVHSRTRSLTIARTELTGAINDGTYTTLLREGHSERQWSTVIDGNERDTHAEADGQTVGIKELFTVGGESCMYPGDDMLSAAQSINCRCTVVGAGLPQDRVQQLGQRFLRIHGALEKQFVVQLLRAFASQRDRILSNFPSPQ